MGEAEGYRKNEVEEKNNIEKEIEKCLNICFEYYCSTNLSIHLLCIRNLVLREH